MRTLLSLLAVAAAGLAGSVSADDAPLKKVAHDLEALAKELGADARMDEAGREYSLTFKTRVFMVHNLSKTGEASDEAHEETGPRADGLMVRIRHQEGRYAGAAVVPQNLRKPYWTTFINAYPIAKGKEHLWLNIQFGARTDPHHLARVKEVLAAVVDDGAPPKGTKATVRDGYLEFDPATALRGTARFGWGLGSVRVYILGRENKECVFDYLDEIEGGWTLYRCRVPVDGPPVRIYEENSGITRSFKLDEARVLARGNLLLDSPEEPKLVWRYQQVNQTDYTTSVADVKAGKGAAAKRGDRVTIRYSVFADRDCDTPLVGVKKDLEMSFVIGGKTAGDGLEAAVLGMQPGGTRRALIREEIAGGISRAIGGVQPGTQLGVEIELLKVGE